MSKIKISELKPVKSDLKELNDLETASIIGGHDEEAESSQDIIQRAMQEAVMRSDLFRNSNLNNKR